MMFPKLFSLQIYYFFYKLSYGIIRNTAIYIHTYIILLYLTIIQKNTKYNTYILPT